ncbi:MAG: efflux RND transporter periplasmic adaptor subunit [Candidatus Aminicenantes bacterium]|nr:efflux RND transporter periplasmic adaptor subunit [Candidatus Aminicenantes bacterium]
MMTLIERRSRIVALTFGLLALTFCGGGVESPPGASPSHNHKSPAVAAETHAHPAIEVSPDKQKAWGLRVGEVGKETLAGRITVPGAVALNENRTAHVSSFVHGQVASLGADLGQVVRKGQPLLTIHSPEFARAQADFLEARARYNLGLADFRRAEALWEARAIEEKEYLRRRAENEKLATEYGAFGSKLHSFGLTHEDIEKLIEKCRLVETQEYKCEVADPNLAVLAPLSGSIIFRDAVVGAPIEPNKILFTLSDLGTLWANLDVPEKDIPFVGPESRVSMRSTLFPGRDFAAKISYVSDVVDEKLRTLRVRVEVDNAAGLLKPNMYVQGIIDLTASGWTGVIAVPEEAVQTLENERIVFVREKEGVFAARRVRVGDRVGDRRIILEGLAEGDVVVLEGAFTLKSELSKTAFGHAHVH